MSIHMNGPITDVHWDGPIGEVYAGRDLVWSALPTVVIDARSDFEARHQLRAALTEYGYDYQTVTRLPFNLDTSSSTNTMRMFESSPSLISVPQMDTSQVTNMTNMFDQARSLISVPQMDTSQVTTMTNMFWGCSSLTDGNVRLIRADGSLPNRRNNMIVRSGLTREPFFLPDGTPID